MKPNFKLLATAAVLIATPTLLPSCTTLTGDQSTTVHAKPGVPGGKVTQTSQINATVTNIDTAKRRVSLVTRAGEKVTVTAGPEIANFNQIRIGDQLKVSYTEEVVIRMAKPGEKVKDTETASLHMAPLGSKPGMNMSATGQIIGTVTAIDHKKRKVTLQFSDGTSSKLPVRDDIDLSTHKVGEKVVIRVTEASAVQMTQP